MLKEQLRAELNLVGIRQEDNEPFVEKGFPTLRMDLVIPPGQMPIPAPLAADGAVIGADTPSLDKGALLDVSVPDPTCATNRSAAAVRDGASASRATKEKYDHYTHRFDAARYTLIPFVVEAFGRPSKSAQRFLKATATHEHSVRGGAWPISHCLSRWRRRVSITLHRSISVQVANNLARTKAPTGAPAPDICAYRGVRLLCRPTAVNAVD
jgi:hypothetical protein